MTSMQPTMEVEKSMTGGDWDDRWGRLGSTIGRKTKMAGDLDSEQEGIDSGAWFQPDE